MWDNKSPGRGNQAAAGENKHMTFKPGTKAFAAAHAQDVAKRAWSDFMNAEADQKEAFHVVFQAAEWEQKRTFEAWCLAGGGDN